MASRSGTAPKFREQLPPSCPPQHADGLEEQVILRLVANEAVADTDFHSAAALGGPCPNGKHPCDWAGCSFFMTKAQAAGLRRFPKLKSMKYVAHVQVGPHSGKAISEARGHVNLWMYADFDPVKATDQVEEL